MQKIYNNNKTIYREATMDDIRKVCKTKNLWDDFC